MKSLITFNNTATPHKGILNNQETDTKISKNLQKRFTRGTGLLLYRVNHSQPDLSNAVHEISKYMDK